MNFGFTNTEEQKAEKIKTIIFDIGNVFVNLDFERWKSSFKEIGIFANESFFDHPDAKKIVTDYGIGKISTNVFIRKFCNLFTKDIIEEKKFKNAWNKIIVRFINDSIETIKKLRSLNYKTYSLSDTNELHTEYIESLYCEIFPNEKFHNLFDKCYLSFQTGFKKTHDDAWLQILKEHNLTAQECIFVDDLLINIQKAKSLGFKTFHFQSTNKLSEIFNLL